MSKFMFIISIIIIAFTSFTCIEQQPTPIVNFNPLEPIRLSYGTDSLQFGDLRLPESEDLSPVIMIIHGGCWRSSYNLSLMDSMSHELANVGYATWNIEYRRTEDLGGGWPGTFTDISAALAYINVIAEKYPIDLENIIVTGHSAGGHLALFQGAQSKLSNESELKVEGLPSIKGIVSLAGITDLSSYYSPSGCGSNVKNLMGGLPNEETEKYQEGAPISHLPLGIPQILINGASDNIVPLSHIMPYFEKAIDLGDPIQLVTIQGAGHFEVITPGSIAWSEIINAYLEIRDL